MHARLWFARWKTAHWLQALVSGLISEPSMPDPSLEPWIASWRPTPASPSVTPASGSANPTPGTSGPTSAKSSALPSLPWFSSKTLEDICGVDSEASAQIFDQWVSELRRDCGLRRKWAHRRAVSDSSLWPTPKAMTGGPQSNRQERHARTGKMAGADLQESAEGWQTKAEMEQANWPTPTGRDAKNPERSAAGMERKADGSWTVDLNTAAHMWQTPGTDSFRSRGGDRVNEMGLDQQARNWPTPAGRDWKSEESVENRAEGFHAPMLSVAVKNWPSPATTDANSAARETTTTGVMHPGTSLTDAIRNWPSPRAEDSEFCGNHPGAQDSLTGVIQDWSFPSTFPPSAPEIGSVGKTCWCGLRGCDQPSHRRKLNIYFDEWLMGWPLNWSSADIALTGFEQWAMESARLLWQWLFAYSQKPMGLGVSGQMDLF